MITPARHGRSRHTEDVTRLHHTRKSEEKHGCQWLMVLVRATRADWRFRRFAGKWFPRQSSAIGRGTDGAICDRQPEGHGAMVDIGPDVKMK